MRHSETRFDSRDTKQLRRETRFDLGQRVSKVKTTPQGFLSIPATLTRTGVLTYTRSDGSTVRELREPEEVFAPQSIESLRNAPLTIKHPGLVTPANVGEQSVGLVAKAERQNQYINGTVIVQRQDAIDAVQKRNLQEISPGYTCDIDPTPGVFNNERYDQKQRNIIYNHVALGPAGWGRSGPEVALRLDGAVSTVEDKPEEKIGMKIRLTLDGVEYEVEVAEQLATHLQNAVAKTVNERNDARTALAEASGKLAAEQKAKADLQTRLDAALDPAEIEKAVQERSDVVAKAKELAPELKCDGLSTAEIKKQALAQSGFSPEELAAGPAFIDGAFAYAQKAKPKSAQYPATFPAVKREDSIQDEPTAADAHRRMVERHEKAWCGEEPN